ncbi:MAG: hypothetical protein PF481_08980 [Bacteroidales bacterium]|jgi:hypothetical protein|nr:hypothetical protein [Bacteroidales bacterium]
MDFSDLFDKNTKKIEPKYLENCLEIKNAPNCFCSNPLLTIEEFIEFQKECFVDKIEKFKPASMRKLQKAIPLLADYILLDIYEKKLFNKKDFTDIFRIMYVWKSSNIEHSLFSGKINQSKVLEIFRYCDKKIILHKNDFEKLDATLNLYRGTAGQSSEEAASGLSWTIDKEIANKFMKDYARMFHCDSGMVLKATIDKNSIIAYFTERFESEIIIDPNDLVNVTINKII